MSVWEQPSPSDWERWEARLLAGEEPSSAARAENQTCSSFKRDDPVRQREALEMSREARGYVADRIVEDDVVTHDAKTGVPVAFKHDASDSQKQFWAKRWQPAYANTTIEVAGQIEHGGTVHIEHERRLTLADVAEFAERLVVDDRSFAGARRELPAARPVLAEPSTG